MSELLQILYYGLKMPNKTYDKFVTDKFWFEAKKVQRKIKNLIK